MGAGWGSGANGLEHLEALRADADVAQRLAVSRPLHDHAQAIAAGQFARFARLEVHLLLRLVGGPIIAAVPQFASPCAKKFRLQSAKPCRILCHMKEPTKARTVRLTLSTWAKFTELMAHYGGRVWLEQAIDKLHRRVFGK